MTPARFVTVAALVLVALVVAPFAYGNPALNSADLILIGVPVAIVAVVWRRHRPHP